MKTKALVFFIFIFSLISNNLLAANAEDQPVNWFFLIVSLLGGLSLFLYGMNKMSDGMKKSAGNRMRSILATLTNNRFVGLLVGAFVTMIIQSSSATTVMLVSFAQAGLINFAQSLGVILGANIGTTFTAQLIAFKLTDYALLMVVIGFILAAFVKSENLKNLGNAILGFGILFFGMKLMSDAMYPLRSYPAFINALQGLENPFVSIVVGAIITALIQSSSAFTGIVIVLAQQNLISLEAGIPLILGANIGTSVTAGLASIGASRSAKRVAMAHTFFNLGGALIFVFWIPTFTELILNISDAFNASVARQIANAHTVFNVGVGLAFIPFTGLVSKLIILILPDKEEKEDKITEIKYLDYKAITTPENALGLARSEIYRVVEKVGEMANAVIQPFLSREIKQDKKYKNKSLIEGIIYRDKQIDYLQNEIVDYLVKTGRSELTDKQSVESVGLISIIHDLKSMSDVVTLHLLPLIELKNTLNAEFSEEGKKELLLYHVKMCKQISRVKNALNSIDPQVAYKILKKEDKYENLERMYIKQHIQRIYGNREESVRTHQLHMEIMNLLTQINVYCGKIGETIYKSATS